MAQRMQRGPIHWEQWERDRKIKVFESKRMRAREARERELAEMEKGGKFVNQGSIRYLSKKENIKGQVENRLLNFGQLAEAKRQK